MADVAGQRTGTGSSGRVTAYGSRNPTAAVMRLARSARRAHDLHRQRFI